MNATATLELTDLSRSKNLTTDLAAEVTPAHSVAQTVEHFLDRVGIRDDGQRWNAFSRGVRLDGKSRLAELPDADASWMIVPEVTAG